MQTEDGKPETVVGIGASAGGLAAIQVLLGSLPEVSGIAYVIVVHLSPDHDSQLAELLQPSCRLPVLQVQGTMALEPDRVYVIPPGCHLEAVDGELHLAPSEGGGRLRAPIDHFWRTMVRVHDGRSIAVLLTGTGTDGTLGLGAVRSGGGVTIVQDPSDAEFDGMPRSAIASGAADRVLPLSQIPDALEKLHASHPRLVIEPHASEESGDLLGRALLHVAARTGQDMQGYKPATVLRRIERRMQLRHVKGPDQYLELLRDDDDEVSELFHDLLITVTRFFRDDEVFDLLGSEILPDILSRKEQGQSLRLWSAGCATGEEAYSLAILVIEALEDVPRPPQVQIFASDLSSAALARARDGLYPDSIEDDVSAERLKRFFVREDDAYRVSKRLREMVVFAPHNVLQDPPFSHLDLAVCRNMLIYLQPSLQRRAVELFHYALDPGGFLVLGPSETIDQQELFSPVHSAQRIYCRQDRARPPARLPTMGPHRPVHLPSDGQTSGRRVDRNLGGMHELAVERYAPPSALVGGEGRILHYSASAGRYFVHPGGEPSNDVHTTVRPELRADVLSGLHSARDLGKPTRARPVRLSLDGDEVAVSVRVHPTTGDEDLGELFLVIFDELALDGDDDGDHEVPLDHVTVQQLERELTVTRLRLQAVIDDYEISQEEMKASHEEMQSTNEELRSTLEELETSKEELQSMNEELITLNQENRHKVDELGQLSSDLQNLLVSTDIATLFLDRSFRILRFTPRVGEVFNVRATDRGRPVSDLTHRLGHDDLVADAEQVLARLVPVEREVRSDDGRWYLTRVVPYRTADDRIEGVVITFIDITTRREAEIDLLALNQQLEERVARQTSDVRTLASNLSMAEHDVRRRVSQMLHDDLQQRLHALQMRVGLAAEHAERAELDRTQEVLAEMEDVIVNAIGVTRRLSVDLSPPILSTEGLGQALRWLGSQMEEMHGLRVSVESGDVPPMPDDTRVFLFQMVRELLFNVVKHADTARARVRVSTTATGVAIDVEDTGQGFDPGAMTAGVRTAGHLGLPGVQERLTLLGGRLEIDSEPGSGTRMRVILPLDGEQTHP